MIKIALNGGKSKEENPNLPTTFAEYKQEIDWFQAHGLHDFHIHFRDPAGLDTLEQKYVQPQWEALKTACPSTPWKFSRKNPLLNTAGTKSRLPDTLQTPKNRNAPQRWLRGSLQ